MIILEHLLKATHGHLSHTGQYHEFSAFSHDTRQLLPGEMFVAVRGARGNGHDFLLDAIRKGATGLLVTAHEFSKINEQIKIAIAQSPTTVVQVEDTRIALQQYTAHILAVWKPLVIAVTGSVGKTSTKEAIATVLSSRFSTFRSWQNYNDLLGIPLSVGRLEPHHTHAVLELGGDHPGEITDLGRLIRPHIGVLTNISPVQLQYFGSLERLAEEMGMLMTQIIDGGRLFYNQDDTVVRSQVEQYRQQYPTRLEYIPFDATHTTIQQIDWNGIRASLIHPTDAHTPTQELVSSLLGRHHLYTMLAAYHIGISLGLSSLEASQALTQITSLPGRLKPLAGIRNARLLDDTHNAAPASILAGLETLTDLTPPGGKRIAVLGDIQHLGDFTEAAHRHIGEHIPRYVDYLITKGERAALIAKTAQNTGFPSNHVIMTSTHEDAAQAVRRLLEAEQTSHDNQYNVVLIKGSEETRMERVTEILMARPWEASATLVRQAPGWKKTIFTHADRPTWVEVDLNAIGTNTRHIASLVGSNVRILVPLKADAYGHGALKVARTVLHNGASMLGVATVSESIPLREAKITAPILVFGYVPFWQMREAIRLDLSITLYTIEAAQELSRAAKALDRIVNVHVKIDTGMSRLGILHDQQEEIITLLREINRLPGLRLEGLYTHFAQADTANLSHARLQLSRFQHVIQMIETAGLRPPIVHAANSAATIMLPEARFDMVRPGVAIYGLQPSQDAPLPEGFRPAMSFKTQVSQVKLLPAGEGISYGSTYVTSQPTRIAVLPVGYADGFRRAPRNWGSVLIHGQEAPLRGRVCMDQCMIDVTSIPDVRIGDEVVLIGHQGDAHLSAEDVADRLGTINYEVVSEILARVPRVD